MDYRDDIDAPAGQPLARIRKMGSRMLRRLGRFAQRICLDMSLASRTTLAAAFVLAPVVGWGTSSVVSDLCLARADRAFVPGGDRIQHVPLIGTDFAYTINTITRGEVDEGRRAGTWVEPMASATPAASSELIIWRARTSQHHHAWDPALVLQFTDDPGDDHGDVERSIRVDLAAWDKTGAQHRLDGWWEHLAVDDNRLVTLERNFLGLPVIRKPIEPARFEGWLRSDVGTLIGANGRANMRLSRSEYDRHLAGPVAEHVARMLRGTGRQNAWALIATGVSGPIEVLIIGVGVMAFILFGLPMFVVVILWRRPWRRRVIWTHAWHLGTVDRRIFFASVSPMLGMVGTLCGLVISIVGGMDLVLGVGSSLATTLLGSILPLGGHVVVAILRGHGGRRRGVARVVDNAETRNDGEHESPTGGGIEDPIVSAAGDRGRSIEDQVYALVGTAPINAGLARASMEEMCTGTGLSGSRASAALAALEAAGVLELFDDAPGRPRVYRILAGVPGGDGPALNGHLASLVNRADASAMHAFLAGRSAEQRWRQMPQRSTAGQLGVSRHRLREAVAALSKSRRIESATSRTNRRVRFYRCR